MPLCTRQVLYPTSPYHLHNSATLSYLQTKEMTSLEGFGSADVTTPFHYGSVADGIRHNPSLEQKLKKKYWKTKQTVIQKLNKSQDEFVVAGDADIDTKLEVCVIQ